MRTKDQTLEYEARNLAAKDTGEMGKEKGKE